MLESIDLTKYVVKLVIFEDRHRPGAIVSGVALLIRDRSKVGVVTAHDTAGFVGGLLRRSMRAGLCRRRELLDCCSTG